MIISVGIPTAKFIVLDLDKPIEDLLCQIRECELVFPLFRKPAQGDDSVHSGRIETQDDLCEWAANKKHELDQLNTDYYCKVREFI